MLQEDVLVKKCTWHGQTQFSSRPGIAARPRGVCIPLDGSKLRCILAPKIGEIWLRGSREAGMKRSICAVGILALWFSSAVSTNQDLITRQADDNQWAVPG